MRILIERRRSMDLLQKWHSNILKPLSAFCRHCEYITSPHNPHFEVWIALANKARTPKMEYPPLRVLRFSDVTLIEGVEEFKVDGVTLRVTNIARTVADCFKFRNKIGLDVAIEALHEAWQSKRVSMDELWHYANLCRVANVMRPYAGSLT